MKWTNIKILLSDPTLQGWGKDHKQIRNKGKSVFECTLHTFTQGGEVRLKAFTLADVLAGMVIMSIVVAMVFGVFNMVNRQTQGFQNLRVELNDFVLMQADLNRQIDASQTIYEVPSGFVLDNDGSETRYFISEGQLLRQNDAGRSVLHPDATKIDLVFEKDLEDPLITGITIKTKLRDQELTAHFTKEYSQAEKINNLLLNEY